jgi:hypothetical protein
MQALREEVDKAMKMNPRPQDGEVSYHDNEIVLEILYRLCSHRRSSVATKRIQYLQYNLNLDTGSSYNVFLNGL